MNKIKSLILPLALLTVCQISQAIIIDGFAFTTPNDGLGNGAFVKIAPGFTQSNPDNTVGLNTFDSPNLWGFDEDQNVAVGPLGLTAEIGGFLAPGTVVASHYVFFDPRTRNLRDGYHQEGWVEFDADILAIFTSQTSLAASDYLANTGVTYQNPELRGLEMSGGSSDSATIDGTDPRKVVVSWNASSPGDYIRVLTKYSPGAEVPVPDSGTTASLLLLGIIGLAAVRRAK